MSMDEFRITGGARIGMLHAGWPMSSLTVTKDRLDINASLIGTYSFTPDQVVSIEPFGQIPLTKGVKINHTVLTYNEKIIFFSFKDPNEIIDEIKKTGFLDRRSFAISNEVKEQVMEKQRQPRFPIRISGVVTVLLIWILFFLLDAVGLIKSKHGPLPLGNGALMAIGFLLIVSTLTLFSKEFRKFVLKEGRDVKEINRFLYLLILMCGFILFMILLVQQQVIS